MLLGTDPELFAVMGGAIIPPIIVEEMGLKRIGTLVEYDPDYHPIYYKDNEIQIIGDGAAFEFNVPPAKEPTEMFGYWNKAKEILSGLLPKGIEIVAKAAMPFDLQFLLKEYNIPEKRLAYSCRFGCDKQYNVYGIGASPEVNAKNIKWRYAGGHLHISNGEDLEELIYPIIYMLDQTVGLTCLFNSPYPEAEIIRQEFYGVPGNFRPQQYGEISGVEYRTPSCSWLDSLPLIEDIYSLVEKVLILVKSDIGPELFELHNENARNSILNYDKEVGIKILEEMRNSLDLL